jgi:hypothetical protein
MYPCSARTDSQVDRLTGSLVLIANVSRKADRVPLTYPCSAKYTVRVTCRHGALLLIANASRKVYIVHLMYPCSPRIDDEAYRLIGSLVAHCKC